ncbi:MAG: tetratricopeptide repeat protein [Candidatus Lernaella stagnicola]|nr:tetratricopeptide repeat protein [Candidatus Lernaella stagnicola]
MKAKWRILMILGLTAALVAAAWFALTKWERDAGPVRWCDWGAGDAMPDGAERELDTVLQAHGSARNRCARGYEVLLGMAAHPSRRDEGIRSAHLRDKAMKMAALCRSAGGDRGRARARLLEWGYAKFPSETDPNGGATRALIVEFAKQLSGELAGDAFFFAANTPPRDVPDEMLTKRSLQTYEGAMPDGHWKIARSHFELARIYMCCDAPQAAAAVGRALDESVGVGLRLIDQACLHVAAAGAADRLRQQGHKPGEGEPPIANRVKDHCDTARSILNRPELSSDPAGFELARACVAPLLGAGRRDAGVALLAGLVEQASVTSKISTPLRQRLLEQYAVALYTQGEGAAAVEAYRELIASLSETLPADHPHLVQQMVDLGNAYLMMGRIDEAQQSHDEAIERMKNAAGDGKPMLVGRRLQDIAREYQRRGHPALAKQYARRAQKSWAAVVPPGHPDLQLIEDFIAHLEK